MLIPFGINMQQSDENLIYLPTNQSAYIGSFNTIVCKAVFVEAILTLANT